MVVFRLAGRRSSTCAAAGFGYDASIVIGFVRPGPEAGGVPLRLYGRSSACHWAVRKRVTKSPSTGPVLAERPVHPHSALRGRGNPVGLVGIANESRNEAKI